MLDNSDDKFAQLRELLNKPPTEFTWRYLRRTFRNWPPEDDMRELALDYARGHLGHWHPKYCSASMYEREEHPCWSLVKHIALDRNTDAKELQELLSVSPNVISIGVAAPRLQQHIGILKDNPQIHSLLLTHCSKEQEWTRPSELEQLTSLVLLNCSYLRDFQFLEDMPQLQCLHVEYGKMQDLRIVQQLEELEELELIQWGELLSLQGIERNVRLKRLGVLGSQRLQSIESVRDLVALEEIKLRGCGLLTEVNALAPLSSLTSLNAFGCSSLRHADGFAYLPALSYLDVTRCNSLHTHQLSLATLCMRTREAVARYQGQFGGEEHERLFRHAPLPLSDLY